MISICLISYYFFFCFFTCHLSNFFSFFFFFFFNDPATPEIYTLSLHDALPICRAGLPRDHRPDLAQRVRRALRRHRGRSEEHTSELQSQSKLVCRLQLEKKTSSGGTLHRPQQADTGPQTRTWINRC